MICSGPSRGPGLQEYNVERDAEISKEATFTLPLGLIGPVDDMLVWTDI